MVIDRVTSLADLAFRGKTDKRYRYLAVLTAAYYGKQELTWREAMIFLNKVATNEDSGTCANIVRDLNYNRELVNDNWIEPPEQLELTPQPQIERSAIIAYSDWLKKKKQEEIDDWYRPQGNRYQVYYDNNNDFYTTNT